MATHSFPDSASGAFKIAMQNFKNALKNDKLYSEICQTTSIEQVYDLTDKLQVEQAKRNDLKHLAKIKPYLDRLAAYAGAIDTFVQAKPDILALIWGPIKLLIQWASVVSASLVGLIDMAAQIGYLLPEFGQAKKIFGDNEHINLLLALFFQDILDFYLVALKFFSMPSKFSLPHDDWVIADLFKLVEMKVMFEALWPKKKPEIEHIINRVGRHTTMLRNEVSLEHVQAAYEARESELEHFKELHRTSRRMEYGILESALAPTFYDKMVDELRGRLCAGTGDWLLKHATVRQWLDFTQEETENTPRVVWLRGIPGAGKTFLAFCVVDKAHSIEPRQSRIVFAFLTHALSVSTTALSIIHSMIFQLARGEQFVAAGQPAQDDLILQDFVCGTSRESLSSDLGVATDLLIKLLNSSGPVHIIVDGLDEIDEAQRTRFLIEVLRVSENCQEARILIASRGEDDIEAILKSKSIVIRVDKCNTSSIQSYVTTRYSQWVQSRGFSAEEKEEIMSLLYPIATKAQGMFMYAQLILRGLDYLDTIDEVRGELKILPTDLNAAYGRIFSRINENLPTQHAREKARRILGWVGCSPMPLTIQELEQALSIRTGDFDQIPRGYATLKMIRLCGPVIELVNDEVYFVHFTAKEYFFNPDITNHLSRVHYTLGLAKACVTYLCQPHHGPDLDQSEITRLLVAGVYRLHHFATDAWLKLVELYCLSTEVDILSGDWKEMLLTLKQLLKSRANAAYVPPDENIHIPRLKHIQDSELEIYELFCRETYFRRKSQVRLFQAGKGEWQASDPLTLRRTSDAVNCALDEKACPITTHQLHIIDSQPCFYDVINLNYGSQPFKCTFVSCIFHRIGFENKKLRQAHSKFHDRPWKCDVPSCEYSEIGFISSRMRDEHLDKFHHGDEAYQPISTSDELSQTQMVPRIIALIKADQVQAILSFIPKLDFSSQDNETLLMEFASTGSSQMVQTVLPLFTKAFRDKIYPRQSLRNCFSRALGTGNLAIMEWLATDHLTLACTDWYAKSFFAKALRSEIFSTALEVLEPFTVYHAKHYGPLGFFKPKIVAATNSCVRRENSLISTWKKLEEKSLLKRPILGTGLSSVAGTTCSLRLASILIQLGAKVNSRWSLNHPTPLHRAAMQDAGGNAIFMRFLLLHGADPDVIYRKTDGFEPDTEGYTKGSYRAFNFKTVRISEEKGPVGISKWLGKSWEELIEEILEARNTSPKETPQVLERPM